jgi:hypothetical protein
VQPIGEAKRIELNNFLHLIFADTVRAQNMRREMLG